MTFVPTWEAHWRERNVPWDRGESPPALHESLAAWAPAPGTRALVPGCGAGYDVLTLARAGLVAVGLDLAESSRARFDEVTAGESTASLCVGDFFEFVPTEPFGLVFDYTFLCAIPPARRSDWATAMGSLLRSGGELWSLVYPIVPAADPAKGPPFRLLPEEVTALLATEFELLESRTPAASNTDRAGKEQLLRFKRR